MLAATGLLQSGRLIELDKAFLNSTLSAGRVYFLGIQKLGHSPTDQVGARKLEHGATVAGGLDSLRAI